MNKHDFSRASGLRVETLEVWLEQRWLIPEETAGGLAFSEREAARARLIRDLQGDLGVNDEGIDVILHLMDQLHGLRRAFADLHQNMRDTSPDAGPTAR